MQNEPNFSKSQMFITLIRTTNYNKKWTLDTWSKRTQTNPILPATPFGGRTQFMVPALRSPQGEEGSLSNPRKFKKHPRLLLEKLSNTERVSTAGNFYFFFTGLQVHCAAFLLHPLQTPFSIGLPHFLHGVHPHD